MSGPLTDPIRIPPLIDPASYLARPVVIPLPRPTAAIDNVAVEDDASRPCEFTWRVDADPYASPERYRQHRCGRGGHRGDHRCRYCQQRHHPHRDRD